MKKRGRRIWGFVLLFLLVAVFLLWNLHAGSVSISAAEIRQILLGRSQDSTKWNIICSIRLPRLLSALILLSSVLSACVTAFAGPISFVGIAVPHLMKILFKTAEPMVMIPACFLGGGAFCLMCDLIARTAFAPTEVSISSVTAVFGAPVVIYMMVRRKAARE